MFVAVDYTTVFNPNYQDWVQYMPEIWLFYIGYPALLAYLINMRGFSGKKLFLTVFTLSLFLEAIIFKNVLLYSFPAVIVVVPIVICIYAFITYLPKYVAERNLAANWRKVLLLTFVWIVISFLSYKTRSG
ncbi:MAG TPA: hypothetical protein G4N92_04495 [Anaerolineae bacterium]|nr:hypothetical protein [Anaerolineae bacterium]